MTEDPFSRGEQQPKRSGRNIFEEVAALRDNVEYNPRHFVSGLNEPLAPQFAERKRQLDAERFQGAVDSAINQGIEDFAAAEDEVKKRGRVANLFDEIQARYRSDPWSQEGARFGYVDFPVNDPFEVARHRRIEDEYDGKIEEALQEGVRRGMESSRVIFDSTDQESTDVPPTI